jgi:hypothetical protein
MRPLDLSGLGITNLEVMAWARQARWQWHKKSELTGLGLILNSLHTLIP